jgi:predicted MFS family arabinose efflux permease
MDEETPAAGAGTTSAPDVPSSRLTGTEWGLLLVLSAVQVTHITDFVIMMPLGPVLTDAFNINPKQFSWTVSAYGLLAGFTSLLAARFIDRFDRKHSLLFLYAGFTVGTLLCAVAPTYMFLVLARGIAGGFAGVMSATVFAIVGDVFADWRRGFAMGVVMSAFSVASIAGIPAGLVLANNFGWRVPFAALGVMSALVWILAWSLLPAFRGHMTHGPSESVDLLAVLFEPTHLRAYSLTVALVFSTFTIHPYLSIYLVNNVGMSKEHLPLIWLIGGIATLLVSVPTGRLADRFGKLRVFRIVGLLTALPTLVMTHLSPVPLWVILLVTTLFMVLASARGVPAMAMITASAGPRYRGSFLTVNSSVQLETMALAPLFAALILGDTEGTAPLTHFPLVGWIAAITIVGSVVLAGRLRPAAGGLQAVDTLDEAVPGTETLEPAPALPPAD